MCAQKTFSPEWWSQEMYETLVKEMIATTGINDGMLGLKKSPHISGRAADFIILDDLVDSIGTSRSRLTVDREHGSRLLIPSRGISKQRHWKQYVANPPGVRPSISVALRVTSVLLQSPEAERTVGVQPLVSKNSLVIEKVEGGPAFYDPGV